jgi:hypothetical protein
MTITISDIKRMSDKEVAFARIERQQNWSPKKKASVKFAWREEHEPEQIRRCPAKGRKEKKKMEPIKKHTPKVIVLKRKRIRSAQHEWTAIERFRVLLVHRGIRDESWFVGHYPPNHTEHMRKSLRMRLQNFRHLEEGADVGLAHVAKDDRRIWERYGQADPTLLGYVYEDLIVS